MATLVDRVQAYLIQQGVGRDPRVAGPLPPVWRQPASGTPAPGEGNGVEIGPTIVIGIISGTPFPRRRFEKDWRRDTIDIWYRTTTWPLSCSTYATVAGLLLDKVNWTMAGLKIIESQEWRGHQLLESNTGQGFTALSSVTFETYSQDLF